MSRSFRTESARGLSRGYVRHIIKQTSSDKCTENKQRCGSMSLQILSTDINRKCMRISMKKVTEIIICRIMSYENLSAFHLCGETGCFGGKSNETGLSTGNFFGKKGIPSEILLFSRFSRNDRKIFVPFATTCLFANRARSSNEPKNTKIYQLNRFK